MTRYTVEIKEEYTTIVDIENCIQEFLRLSADSDVKKQLFVKATVRMVEIDIRLIGYFILFQKRYKGDLEIVLALPYNEVNEADSSFEHKLLQYGTNAYLVHGKNVFSVLFGEHQERRNFHFNVGDRFPEGWFVWSKSFTPFLLIDKHPDNSIYDLLFETGLDQLVAGKVNFEEKNEWGIASEFFRNNCIDYLKLKSDPIDRLSCLVNLGYMAFINALNEAKIAGLYFQDKKDKSKTGIRAGALRDQNAYDYFKSIKPVFDELRTMPLCYQFIFSITISSELLQDDVKGKDALNKITRPKIVKKIKLLWGFTKNMVAGLLELVKNVREHAKPELGILIGRIYQQGVLGKLLKSEIDNDNSYTEHVKQIGPDSNSVLDINVFDLGETGVSETLLKNTRKWTNETLAGNIYKELLENDIAHLADRSVQFQHLLDPYAQPRLNQQSKRAIVHCGLQTFARLCIRNNGMLVASTVGHFASGYRETAFIPSFLKTDRESRLIGTNYHAVFPVDLTRGLLPLSAVDLRVPSESSAKEIKGIEELMKYNVFSENEMSASLTESPATNEQSSNPILIITPNISGKSDRSFEERLWNYVTEKVQMVEKRQVSLICIDLEKNQTNPSLLFRLLGNWELYYPDKSIIITNITADTLIGLYELNESFLISNPNLPFWNEARVTLLYSYSCNHTDSKAKTDRFYFSDAFWGKSLSDFVSLNRMIARTNFNIISLLPDSQELKRNSKEDEISVDMSSTHLFYNKNVLLPFDLLFKGAANLTLFEHTALRLLKNKIKVQN